MIWLLNSTGYPGTAGLPSLIVYQQIARVYLLGRVPLFLVLYCCYGFIFMYTITLAVIFHVGDSH